MGCGADVFPAETHWTVSLQAGDAEHEIVNQSIYTDNSPNQPTSRECTLITNGDNQLTAMAKVREAADKLEKIVPDDLWPLPKYAEMLFIR